MQLYHGGLGAQNFDTWEQYSAGIGRDELPLSRAYRPDADERLIRELVLQLKLGRIRPSYFFEKYHVNILDRFREPLTALSEQGYLAEASENVVALTREGLLRVDSLLRRFFQPRHAGIRYT